MSLDEQIRAIVDQAVDAKLDERLPAAVAQKLDELVRTGKITVHEDEPYADLDALTGLAPAPAPTARGTDEPLPLRAALLQQAARRRRP